MPRAAKKPPALLAETPAPTGPRILNVHQGSEAWQRERQNRIGGSDANVVMLASPYATPFELWQVKLGKKPKPEGWAMAKGHDLEPLIMERYEAARGTLVEPVVMVAANDWQIASLDGRTLDGDLVVEAKQLDLESFELALQGIVPVKYVPQVQHNLGVTGAQILELACYHEASDRFHILECTPDPAYFAKLTEAEREFRECLRDAAPPALTDRDVVEHDDEAWQAAAAAWLETKQQIEDLEATLATRREVLVALAGDNNARGAGMLVTFASRAGNVDWKKLAAKHGISAEEIAQHRAKRISYTVVQAAKAGKAVL